MPICRRALTARLACQVYLAHFYRASLPAEDRKHCSGIDWLSPCGVIALLILRGKCMIFPLQHLETDAVLRECRTVSCRLCEDEYTEDVALIFVLNNPADH